MAKSPLGNFPELAAMYQSSFQLPISNAQVGAQDYQDQTSIANANAAKSAANYRVVSRPDGGFGFYDPSGKEISAADYAQVAGKTPQEVLKGSQNPIDIQYQQDYDDLNNYIKQRALAKTDPKAAAQAKAVEDQVNKQYGINLAKQNPHQVVQTFMNNYPTVYGGTKAGISGNSVLVPGEQYALGAAAAANPGGYYQPSSGGGFNSGQ